MDITCGFTPSLNIRPGMTAKHTASYVKPNIVFTNISRTTHDTQNRRDSELFLKGSPTALWP